MTEYEKRSAPLTSRSSTPTILEAKESTAPEPPKQPLVPIPPRDPRLINWDGPDDPQNPQNLPRRRKWLVTAVCLTICVNVTFASSAPAAASQAMKEVFGASDEATYGVISCFLLGYAIGPSFWGPGSEFYGRRLVLVSSMVCYTLFFLGQALAQNMASILVTRFFCGFFGVAPLTVCGGVIADVWSAVDRGTAMALFTASVSLGPVFGPIVAGFIASSDVSWRWIYWVMMIYAGFCTAVVFFLLPETYPRIILEKKLKHLQKTDPKSVEGLKADRDLEDWSLQGIMERTLLRPFKMLLLEPILLLITIYMSMVYGVLYGLFEAVPVVFIERRGFTIWQNGLVFISLGLGNLTGATISWFMSRRYAKLVVEWQGFPPPEHRLYAAMIGAPALVIGGFWLGWTGEYASVHWIVPTISLYFLGMSFVCFFNSFLTYIVDTYLMYAASGLASNTILRSLVAAAFPLFTTQMYHNLGVNWASTLIAFIAVLLAPMPFLFFRYGARIRMKSKFAPCMDLKIAAARKEAGNQDTA
ncbi:MFS general substrate transporter [Cylindrobasidium torrendii FP15055 ss-10]|uniref:MFS general substrate transporter n=1 Tax=Cylindrobasidium torrendii FP15055 ss-10 TaxID=1314674 RepID=A0A0D7B5Z1_9AGAR|nr:MFS general substrate transporter [Cylindrobasidium torrendii FP15055 ss-10]